MNIFELRATESAYNAEVTLELDICPTQVYQIWCNILVVCKLLCGCCIRAILFNENTAKKTIEREARSNAAH